METPMYAFFFLLLLLVQSPLASFAYARESETDWIDSAKAIANFTAFVNALDENVPRPSSPTLSSSRSGIFARDDNAVEVTFPPPDLSMNASGEANDIEASLAEDLIPMEDSNTNEPGVLILDEDSNSGDANLESGETITSSATAVRAIYTAAPWILSLIAALVLDATTN